MGKDADDTRPPTMMELLMAQTSKTKAEKSSSVTKAWQAAVNLTEGSSAAMADGLRTFGKTLELKKFFDVQTEAGLVGAMLKGYGSYFSGMAKVSQDILHSLHEDAK